MALMFLWVSRSKIKLLVRLEPCLRCLKKILTVSRTGRYWLGLGHRRNYQHGVRSKCTALHDVIVSDLITRAVAEGHEGGSR